MLTESVVDSLKLRVAPLPDRHVVLFGGYRMNRFAVGHDIDFGGLKAPYKEFIIMAGWTPARGRRRYPGSRYPGARTTTNSISRVPN